MNSSRLISLIVSSALAVSLSACNTTPTASNSAQLVSGPITALSASSLTVSGKTFSLNTAKSISINGETAKSGALSVGQHVTVKAEGTNATDIDIDLELKGTITTVNVVGGTIDIAGQIVIVSSLTRIDLGDDDDTAPSTPHTISDLKAGDFVEVTGTTDPVTGNITASKIEVKTDKEIDDDGDHKDNHIKGTVSGLVAGATSFTLGTITVNCAAPCTLPTGLKNGDTVHVKGTLDATGLILTATKVHIDGEFHKHPLPGSSVVLERKIKQLDEATKTFKLCYLTVDYSTAIVTGTLTKKARVKVEGVVDATDATLVHATTVTVLVSNEPNDDGSHGDHGHHGGENGGTPGTGGNSENPGK